MKYGCGQRTGRARFIAKRLVEYTVIWYSDAALYAIRRHFADLPYILLSVTVTTGVGPICAVLDASQCWQGT